MKHIMKLNEKYFEYIKNGTKRIEIRLNDEKRKKIKVGDEIVFQKEPELTEEICTKVIGLITKNNFKELIKNLNISQYADKNEAEDKFLEDLYKFYTKEQGEKYGVIGIEIKLENENIPISIKKEYLYNIDLEDDFFASFRKDYFEFDKWFKKKQQEGVQAYVTTTNENKITSFLLLKDENETEDYSFFKKPFKPGKRIKISTFKVSDTGKKIGKTFIQIILNEAIKKNVDEIYVTIFEKHKSLINLLEQNGFKLFTYKNTKKGNGVVEKELIYVKDMIIEKLNANMI